MNNDKYILLTPSARSFFHEMEAEYVDTLLDNAYEIAIHNGTGSAEVSLRDIVEARNSLGNSNKVSEALRRKERWVSTALLGGFSYVTIGLILFFVTNEISIRDYLLSVQSLWLLLVLFGLFFMTIPLILIFKRMTSVKQYQYGERDYFTYSSPDTIVKMWNIIERKSLELMKVRGINNDASFKNIYDFLTHELNSREYIENITEVMGIRNKIVHSRDFFMKKDDIDHTLNLAQKVVNELDMRIQDSK